MSFNASILEARKKYLQYGRLPKSLLPEGIFQAWERSHTSRVNPKLDRAPSLSVVDAERLVQKDQSLVEAAAPYMMAISRASRGYIHAVMLGRTDGTIVSTFGDQAVVNGPGALVKPGDLFGEEALGCNGIGTSLKAQSFVEVKGAQHFIEGFQGVTCQAIPIYGPENEVKGALSAGILKPEAPRGIREILICAVHGVEAELTFRRMEESFKKTLINSPFRTNLENIRQDIVQLYSSGRLNFEMAAEMFMHDGIVTIDEFLANAGSAIREFKEKSCQWIRLVNPEAEGPKILDVLTVVHSFTSFLCTEMRISGINITLGQQEIIIDLQSHSSRKVLEISFLLERGVEWAKAPLASSKILLEVNNGERPTSLFSVDLMANPVDDLRLD